MYLIVWLITKLSIASPRNTVVCDNRNIENNGHFSKILHSKAIVIGNYLVTHGLGSSNGMKPIGSCLDVIQTPEKQDARTFICEYKNEPVLQYGILYDYDSKLFVSHLKNKGINLILKPDSNHIKYGSKNNHIKLYRVTIELVDIQLINRLTVSIEKLLMPKPKFV